MVTTRTHVEGSLRVCGSCPPWSLLLLQSTSEGLRTLESTASSIRTGTYTPDVQARLQAELH